MKKMISLSLVALFAISAMAQKLDVAKSFSRSTVRTSRVEKVIKAPAMPYSEYKVPSRAAQAAAAVKEDTLQFIRPLGAFFTDVVVPIILSDEGNVTFYDYSKIYSGNKLYWGMISEGQLYMVGDSANQPALTWPGKDENGEELYMEAGDAWRVPMLFTADEGGNIMKTYSWGAGLKELYAEYPAYASFVDYADPHIYVRPDYTMPITTCAMYTDTILDGQEHMPFDDFPVGDGQGGYAWGTGMKMKDNTVIDTLIVVFDNLPAHTLWMDSATLSLFSNVQNMIPAGAEVKIELVPAGMNQNYQWVFGNKVLATAIATQTDLYGVKAFQTGGGYYGYLDFAFGAKNGLGGFTPAPVSITGPFAAKIILNNAQGNNFGIYSDYYYPDGQSFFFYKGNLYGYGAMNIHLSLNAKFIDKEQGVENTKAAGIQPVKVIQNGQVLIKKGEKLYNVMGAEL